MTHELKTWPKYWLSVAMNEKAFEVRRADRPFTVGDDLHLREWDPHTQRYTGRAVVRRIVYILPGGGNGIEEEFCVLGLAL